jgi:BASS family bile acid:Na+ symporter
MGFDAATLLQLVKMSVTVLILAIGMQSTVDDLTYLWRRPWLLTKSMVAMYVFVPLMAVALARVLPVPFGLKVAVVVVAISAGAPLVPRKLMPLSNDGYVFSVIATSSLLAIVTVPLWLIALSALSGATPEITPAEVARLLGKAFLLPLAIGMGIRMLAPDLSEKLADVLLKAGGIVLTLGGLVLLVLGWPLLKEAGWISLLVLGLLTALALAIGHLLGGPEEEDRTALAIACATRHLGIAVLVAAAVPGQRTGVLVIAYLVASLLASIPYIRWRKRFHKAALAAGNGPESTGGAATVV